MSGSNKQKPLVGAEYILLQPDQNLEIAGARRELIEVVHREWPDFFADLWQSVYPMYQQVVEKRPQCQETGWTLQSWVALFDPEREFMPHLLAWAKKFNVSEEEWVFDGALRILNSWCRDPDLRNSLDVSGFHSALAVDSLDTEELKVFCFKYPAWDPQSQRWAKYRAAMTKQFQRAVRAYEERLRSLMRSQGGVLATPRFGVDNLVWFTLYQIGGMSADRILAARPDLKGDASTIRKGVKAAAHVLQWKNLRKYRNGVR